MGIEIYDSILPAGYELPSPFLSFIEGENTILPWRFFVIDNSSQMGRSLELQHWYDLLRNRFPEGILIPFAYVYDDTGFWGDGWPVVASFDPAANNAVRIYDSQSSKSSPWTNAGFAGFEDWFVNAEWESGLWKAERAAIDQMIADDSGNELGET